MFLYAIADHIYRKFKCNQSASRGRSTFKLWWNSIVQRAPHGMHHITGFNANGEPIYTDMTSLYEAAAIASAVDAYNNQPAGKKDMQSAMLHGMINYHVMQSGILNPMFRFFVLLWDIILAQPFIFIWDMCMLPCVEIAQQDGRNMWDNEIEKERTITLARLENMSISEITKAPVWRNW